MTEGEYIQILDRALASEHGVCLEFDNSRIASLFRQKFYQARRTLRGVARVKQGFSRLQKRGEPPITVPFDALQFRLCENKLYIVRQVRHPWNYRQDDELPYREMREIGRTELPVRPDERTRFGAWR
jgi:hypothetical protein